MSAEMFSEPTLRTTVAPLLEIEGLRIERVRAQRTDTIVSSMSLSIGAGETVGIVGESGSGKSISARAIIGLLPANFVARGEVRYRDRDLVGLKNETGRQFAAVRSGW